MPCLGRVLNKPIMKKLYTQTFSEDLTFLVAGQPNEHGVTGINFLSEWDDNSIGYGGTVVHNKISIDSDGDIIIVRGNNTSRCTDEDFKSKFIGKKLGKVKRNKTESVGQAQMGGSIAPHSFSYFQEVGYVTPDNDYRVAIYKYDTQADLQTITPSKFNETLVGLHVDVFEVSFEDFIERHGLGKSFNGWYNKSKLFRGLPFKVDYDGIIEFSRMRYQYRIGKRFTYELQEHGVETPNTTPLKPYFFPSNCGNLLRHYSDMNEVLAEDGDMLHTMKVDESTYYGTLHTYESIRKSQTDKLQTIFRMAGGQSMIHPLHLAELDKPTVDIVSADGTYITTVYLWPNATQWPAEFNNRKWVFVLSADSESPFARLKVKFRNTTFPIAVRELVKKMARHHGLLSDTSGVKLKKDEDAEIDNYKKILQDASHPSHAVTYLNTKELFGDNFDISKITQNDDDNYLFKLDLTFDDAHLQEWQFKGMDDEHLTELLARVGMKQNFKTITWVHGGHSDKLTKKLKTMIDDGGYNLRNIEKIQIIDKRDLFIPQGWQKANIVYQQKS